MKENTNCLKNWKCPECGNTDHFIVEVTTQIHLYDEGSDTHGDLHHDENSYARCAQCDHDGKAKDFQWPKPPKPAPPHICIIMEGGIIQDILTNARNLDGTLNPDNAPKITVIDYDTDGADENELKTIRFTNPEWRPEQAYVFPKTASHDPDFFNINPDIFTLTQE